MDQSLDQLIKVNALQLCYCCLAFYPSWSAVQTLHFTPITFQHFLYCWLVKNMQTLTVEKKLKD